MARREWIKVHGVHASPQDTAVTFKEPYYFRAEALVLFGPSITASQISAMAKAALHLKTSDSTSFWLHVTESREEICALLGIKA